MSDHVTKVMPSELNDMIVEDDILVIDVRPYEMYRAGHIADAISFPYDEIAAQAARQKIPDTNTPFVVYCQRGFLSKIAAATFDELGYTAVYDMSGGIEEWPFGLEAETS